ncbi:hypothetical protein M9H77_36200 [Catharanthus roseus]|uniref:Uncharacterized protein n=1 Tax=Catharanthus roseus TaxID=4058 RepID=A0ACB9ZRI4_CATRO|nr:hypothetical protein M9H77_36200 [Catharanthus roseus]
MCGSTSMISLFLRDSISKTKALTQKEVQNTLALKASSFTKQDDESSSTGSDNEVHYENQMYESLMAEDSTASSVPPVMMTGMLGTEEQLENLTRLVEGLGKCTQEQEYSITQLMNHLEEVARQVKLYSRSRRFKKKWSTPRRTMISKVNYDKDSKAKVHTDIYAIPRIKEDEKRNTMVRVNRRRDVLNREVESLVENGYICNVGNWDIFLHNVDIRSGVFRRTIVFMRDNPTKTDLPSPVGSVAQRALANRDLPRTVGLALPLALGCASKRWLSRKALNSLEPSGKLPNFLDSRIEDIISRFRSSTWILIASFNFNPKLSFPFLVIEFFVLLQFYYNEYCLQIEFVCNLIIVRLDYSQGCLELKKEEQSRATNWGLIKAID